MKSDILWVLQGKSPRYIKSALYFVAPVLNFMASAIVPLSQAALSKATRPEEQGEYIERGYVTSPVH